MSCNYDNHWIKHFWRPMCAYVYIGICVFDFVIMPFVFEYIKSRDKLDAVVVQIEKIDNPDVQLALIKRVDYAGGRSWEPMTTKDGSMFHLSFGAIIGANAAVRGLRKPNNEKSDA